jgi:hypothetical protein
MPYSIIDASIEVAEVLQVFHNKGELVGSGIRYFWTSTELPGKNIY